MGGGCLHSWLLWKRVGWWAKHDLRLRPILHWCSEYELPILEDSLRCLSLWTHVGHALRHQDRLLLCLHCGLLLSLLSLLLLLALLIGLLLDLAPDLCCGHAGLSCHQWGTAHRIGNHESLLTSTSCHASAGDGVACGLTHCHWHHGFRSLLLCLLSSCDHLLSRLLLLLNLLWSCSKDDLLSTSCLGHTLDSKVTRMKHKLSLPIVSGILWHCVLSIAGKLRLNDLKLSHWHLLHGLTTR